MYSSYSFDFSLFSKSLLSFFKKTSSSNKLSWATNLVTNSRPGLHDYDSKYDFFSKCQ